MSREKTYRKKVWLTLLLAIAVTGLLSVGVCGRLNANPRTSLCLDCFTGLGKLTLHSVPLVIGEKSIGEGYEKDQNRNYSFNASSMFLGENECCSYTSPHKKQSLHWGWFFVAIISASLGAYGLILLMKGFADDPSGMMLLRGILFSVTGWVVAHFALLYWWPLVGGSK